MNRNLNILKISDKIRDKYNTEEENPMKKNTYTIRVETEDNLYADYMVEAENIWFAKMRARAAFFRDYPEANKYVKLSLTEPNPKVITEIMNIIKEG